MHLIGESLGKRGNHKCKFPLPPIKAVSKGKDIPRPIPDTTYRKCIQPKAPKPNAPVDASKAVQKENKAKAKVNAAKSMRKAKKECGAKALIREKARARRI
jgi:hypothetical protein